MLKMDRRLIYWSAESSRGEIAFLVQCGGDVVPAEVKVEENLRWKSLRAFSERYGGMSPARLSLSGCQDEGWMRNVPLWAVARLRWLRSVAASRDCFGFASARQAFLQNGAAP